jgi:hypothetical protein
MDFHVYMMKGCNQNKRWIQFECPLDDTVSVLQTNSRVSWRKIILDGSHIIVLHCLDQIYHIELESSQHALKVIEVFKANFSMDNK